jgi:hypothetical protein
MISRRRDALWWQKAAHERNKLACSDIFVKAIEVGSERDLHSRRMSGASGLAARLAARGRCSGHRGSLARAVGLGCSERRARMGLDDLGSDGEGACGTWRPWRKNC